MKIIYVILLILRVHRARDRIGLGMLYQHNVPLLFAFFVNKYFNEIGCLSSIAIYSSFMGGKVEERKIGSPFVDVKNRREIQRDKH